MNAGLDLHHKAVAQWNQTEAEQAKEHPQATTTESRTSRSQLQPEMLSVRCHKQTPTDDVPVLPSWKMRRSSPQTPTCWTPLHQGGHSHSQEAEEDAKRRLCQVHFTTNSEENDEPERRHQRRDLQSLRPRTLDQSHTNRDIEQEVPVQGPLPPVPPRELDHSCTPITYH